MKRSASDYWKLYHDDFWDSQAVIRMSPRTKGAYLFLLGIQAKHGYIPADPKVLAAICQLHFPKFMRWDWPSLEPLFPVSSTDDTRRMNERQAVHLQVIDESRASDTLRKRLERAGKADRPLDVQPLVEERRGEKKRGEPRPGAGGKRPPSGRTQEFIAAWQSAYREHEGREYVMHAGDGPGTAAFEKIAPTVTASEFRAMACALLTCADVPNVDPFWVTNRNLRTLCSRWSDVPGIRVQSNARARAKAPPKSFAQESFENLANTSPTLNPQGYEDAARSIALPPRQPPGTLASGVAGNAHPSRQLRALPREAESHPDQHAGAGD